MRQESHQSPTGCQNWKCLISCQHHQAGPVSWPVAGYYADYNLRNGWLAAWGLHDTPELFLAIQIINILLQNKQTNKTLNQNARSFKDFLFFTFFCKAYMLETKSGWSFTFVLHSEYKLFAFPSETLQFQYVVRMSL